MTPAIWAGRRVLVTGHTGFKGGWLSLWLAEMGAVVTGLALPPPAGPSLFAAAHVADRVTHIEGDIRDPAIVHDAVAKARPEAIVHLAAQPLVRESYAAPLATWDTNVMGTAHLLEAVRGYGPVPAIVCVTTDKCYENREWVWPYRESDPMGGHDPYSASKGAAELAIASWRRAFFAEGGTTLVASARAGNVIGGGDWSADRLVPDLLRAAERGEAPVIRHPGAIRPWQHVLEALGGYLALAERLLAGEAAFAEAWNFGPEAADARSVAWIVERLGGALGQAGWQAAAGPQPHEAETLRLDISKARARLGWQPRLDLDSALAMTAEWHRRVQAGEDAGEVTVEHIRAYRALAEARA